MICNIRLCRGKWIRAWGGVVLVANSLVTRPMFMSRQLFGIAILQPQACHRGLSLPMCGSDNLGQKLLS